MSDCFCQPVCLRSKPKASRSAGSLWTTDGSCTSKIRWYGTLTHTYTDFGTGVSLYFKPVVDALRTAALDRDLSDSGGLTGFMFPGEEMNEHHGEWEQEVFFLPSSKLV